MLYDSLIITALLMLAAVLALPVSPAGQQAFRDPGYTAYLLGVWFLYLAWCWTRGGQTVGMRAWRVRLISADGSRPGWRQAAVRFMVSLASALCLGAGFWLSLGHPQRACWHDRASRTRLVRRVPNSGRAPQHQDRGHGQQQGRTGGAHQHRQ